MALRPKQARFVSEYLKDLNATQAAIRAGYPERTARQAGSRLLTHVDIQAAVSVQAQQTITNANVTAERVISEYARVGFSDVRNLFDGERLKNIHELTEDEAASVAMVEVNKRNLTAGDGQTDVVLKVRLWDKMKALDSLASYFNLLKGQSLTVNQISITINKGW